MRSFVSISMMLMIAALVSSCSQSNTPANTQPATPQTHFYPLNDGQRYTYSRYENGKSDTIACIIRIGRQTIDKNVMLIESSNTPLYYIGFTPDALGNSAAMLQRGDTTLFALDGALETNATWIADEAHGVTATVIDRYDGYYLPGRVENFSDVLVVKYHTNGDPDNLYTLRYFARNHGLILERHVAPYGDVASLELLGIQ